MTITQWSTTPSNNATGVTDINFAEGQPPSSVNDSARQLMADVAAWRDAIDPAGRIVDFAGTAVPSGWLQCDGSTVSRATYARLFTAIGTTWGAGDGSTTFALPNLSRRVTVGSGGSGTATLANSVGSTGGAETHTLTEAEMPSHSGHVDSQNTSAGGGGGGNGTVSWSNRGSGAAHNNMQPSAVMLKIIRI